MSITTLRIYIRTLFRRYPYLPLGAVLLGCLFIVLIFSLLRNTSQDTPPRNSFPIQSSYAATYYVSPNGNDANDARTSDTPFKSIDKALSLAEAGDEIRLADGEYRQTFSTLKSGTKDKQITITGSRNAVVLGTTKESRIAEIRHDYIRLIGFTINGLDGDVAVKESYRDKLLYVIGSEKKDGVDGLVIDNMLLENAGGECLRLRYFARDNEVKYSTIRHCGVHDFRFKGGSKNGEGIYIGTAPEQRDDGKNPTNDIDASRNNHVHHNVIETYGNECVDVKEGASNNLIEYNTCQFQMDHDSGGFDARGNDNIFRYNISKNNKGAGIRLGGDTMSDGINNQVYGNTIENNGMGAVKTVRTPQAKLCDNKSKNNGDPQFKRSKGIDPDRSCKNV
ncbi:DUF1565 domain-containing protein [bacterium]|nr:MAG: DUF1565 domain-containing protein [bacterium]